MANTRKKRRSVINLILSEAERELILKASSLKELPPAIYARSLIVTSSKKILKEAGQNG